MKRDQIKHRLENGFRPFALQLSDGRQIPVPHPEFVALGEKVVVVITSGDRVLTIDPVHIVSIEETHPPGGARD